MHAAVACQFSEWLHWFMTAIIARCPVDCKAVLRTMRRAATCTLSSSASSPHQLGTSVQLQMRATTLLDLCPALRQFNCYGSYCQHVALLHTCPSCACVSFLAVLACTICFFSSVDTLSSARTVKDSWSKIYVRACRLSRHPGRQSNVYTKSSSSEQQQGTLLTVEVLCLCLELVCCLAAGRLCVSDCN
jgi:hypothetical protein